MKTANPWAKLLLTVMAVLFVSSSGWAQRADNKPLDPLTAEAQKLISQAWSEVSDFNNSPSINNSAPHPGKQWSAKLWQFRAQHPRTSAGALAAGTAIEMMVLAKQADEAIAMAITLEPTDNAWGQTIHALSMAYASKNALDQFIPKAEALLLKTTDMEVKASIYWAIARAYERKGNFDDAKKSFQAVIGLNPASELAQRAKGNIYELENLQVGQVPPPFSAKLTDGKQISLSDLKGKVVVLQFYASWCGICMAELPKVKEVNEKYKNKGLALIGISLDDDRNKFKSMVAEKQVDWPQVMDGQAFAGEIPKLFNVRNSANFYILDRDGRIAAKGRIGRELEEKVAKLFQ